MNARYLILADESADWRIGGLRQLERLLLALNEFVGKNSAEPAVVEISWRPGSREHLPARSWPHLILAESGSSSDSVLLSTRLLVRRNELDALRPALPSGSISKSWEENFRRFESIAVSSTNWLADHAAARKADRRFLQRAGKPQDGFVSRWLNRPVSRAVSRWLLKFPITPNGWTFGILILPLLATALVARGGYASILAGTLVYHLHSILDGCDGEIARAKYLESARGKHIDDFCDIVGALFFVIGLGFGLSRSGIVLYFYEGVVCAAMIATNEILLRLPQPKKAEPTVAGLSEAFYPRHRQMIQNSGIMFMGDRVVWLVVQATKRDVGILLFVLLALGDVAQWIVHLWTGTTVLSLSLTLSALVRRLRA